MVTSVLGYDVRAVFFDAVGTLLHPSPSAPEVYASVGARHGSRRTVAEIRDRFRDAFGRQEQLDEETLGRTSEAREVARWQTIVREVLDDATAPKLCFNELFTHFSRPNAWAWTPGTTDVLRELARRGMLLGLASNYDHRLRTVMSGMPALVSISHLAISSEIGWRKPSEHFFAALCRAVQLPPERIVLIGDDLVNDYEGARAAGMQAVLFDPARKHAGSDRMRIDELADLLN